MKRHLWLLCLLFWQSQLLAQGSVSTGSVGDSPIGYATVQEAFDALVADPTAIQNEYEGWTSFNQKSDGKYIIWSFTPEYHPVHPTAVRRVVVKKDGEVFIAMAVLCHANRFDCDKLIEQFQQINENLKRKLADDGAF